MVALACYFDESSKGRNYAVGGYLASVNAWENYFTPSWNEVLANAPHKLSEFKTSDCRQGRGEFEGWTERERLDLTSRLVSVIIDCSNVIGLSMVVRFPGLPERNEDRHSVERVGYASCITICIYDMLKYHADFFRQPREYVRAIADKKRRFHQMFAECLERAKGTSEFSDMLLDPVSGDSKDLPPLQAADLLAYETRKELENRLEGRPVSKALERLVSGRIHFARCAVYPSVTDSGQIVSVGLDVEPSIGVLFHSDRPIRESGLCGAPIPDLRHST